MVFTSEQNDSPSSTVPCATRDSQNNQHNSSWLLHFCMQHTAVEIHLQLINMTNYIQVHTSMLKFMQLLLRRLQSIILSSQFGDLLLCCVEFSLQLGILHLQTMCRTLVVVKLCISWSFVHWSVCKISWNAQLDDKWFNELSKTLLVSCHEIHQLHVTNWYIPHWWTRIFHVLWTINLRIKQNTFLVHFLDLLTKASWWMLASTVSTCPI